MGQREGAQGQGLAGRAKTALGFASRHRGKIVAAAGALGFLRRRRQKQSQDRRAG